MYYDRINCKISFQNSRPPSFRVTMDNSRESYQDLLRRCTKRQCKTETNQTESTVPLPALYKGDVIELYGGHVTGATSLLCSVSLDYLVRNPSACVFYIDCDRGVPPHKFLNLLSAAHPNSDKNGVLQRLCLSQCCSIHELISVLETTEKQHKNHEYPDLLIIDNILSFYWSCTHDRNILRDKIIPKVQNIKPHCAVLLSWHPPVKQPDNILPPSWSKLVTKRLHLTSQANPRVMEEEGGSREDRLHRVQFSVDLRTGCVTGDC